MSFLPAGRWIALVLCIACFASPPARADHDEDEFALEDAIEVVVLPREVQAVDAEGGGRLSERLEIGESVIWNAARGRVAVVVTDRRLLAVSTRSGAWQTVRFRRGEAPPADVQLGGRVAVCATSKRAFGFDGGSANLVETSLGPREAVIDLVAGQNVGVVVTSRRALGLSARAGGFFVADLHVGEDVVSLSARASHATLETSERMLVFRALRGGWEEERPPRR